MKMSRIWLAISMAGAATIATQASAATIDFSTLPDGNPPVTTYSENGFTFAVVAGVFNGTSGNGAPPPSVYTPQGSGTADITNGGLFTFSSVALGNGAFSGNANFTLTGFLGNLSVYSFGETVSPFAFNTYQNTGNASTIIDRLEIAVNGDGNIDNINVNSVATSTPAVPEPASWMMMILGMGAVGSAMRSAKRRSDEKFDAKIKRITYGIA